MLLALGIIVLHHHDVTIVCLRTCIPVQICNLLKALTRGSLSGGASCSVDRGDLCCPLACSEPTKYSVRNFFIVRVTLRTYVHTYIYVRTYVRADDLNQLGWLSLVLANHMKQVSYIMASGVHL